MLENKRILITGVTGKAVIPIAAALARRNEVWGQARFSDPSDRQMIEGLGVKACSADLSVGDVTGLPSDVDYLLHFAWMRGSSHELEKSLKVNVEGAGRVLHHCRKAKAALVVSSMAIYAANEDPLHEYTETDRIGPQATSYAETSPVSKLGLETMAHFCSETFELPVTIARLNTVLGPHKAYHGKQIEAVFNGDPVVVPADPNAHSPIHSDDMILQIEPLLSAARLGGFTVNWGGDELITSQQAVARAGERMGRQAKIVVARKDGGAPGNASDATLRRSITGPCTVPFWDGYERLLDEMLAGRSLDATAKG